MSWRENIKDEIEDPVVEQALKHFKESVDAWSDAAYHRPRTALRVARHGWRLAASWALAGVLAACAVAGGVYERQHRQELARVAAAKAAQQKAQQEQAAEKERAAEQNASAGDEDLLATVDSDVSRQVPAAMEPLAELMDENGTAAGTQ